MEFKNHKIIEAVCAFRFNPPENNWDITSYAGYPQMVEGGNTNGYQKRKRGSSYPFRQ